MELCLPEFVSAYPLLHVGGMDRGPDIRKLLFAMKNALPGKGTQQQLAERLSIKGKGPAGLKIGQPRLSKWMREEDPEHPDGRAYARIIAVADEMGIPTQGDISSEDVAASLDPVPRPTIKLQGYVGAGSVVFPYTVDPDSLEEVDAPFGANDRTVAVEIKGKSFGPLMDRWVVFYDDVRSPITEDLYGEICVVGLSDDRIMLKQIKRERDGSLTLLSNSNEDPIPNARIEWAAKVVGMRPR